MLVQSRYDFNKLEKFLDIRSKDIHPEELDNSVFIDPAFFVIGSMIKKGDRVLDVGCGHGYALDKFREHGANPIGITLCDDDYNKATAKGHDVRYMDMSFLEFDDEYFDIVWARHSLEHSPFPLFTLTEFHRVLKPSGLLYLEVPAPDTKNNHEFNQNHYSVMGSRMWQALLKKANLKPLGVYNITLKTENGNADVYYRMWAEK